MKFILLLLALNAQDSSIRYHSVEHSDVYEFRINYWFNMHHFLKHEAFLNSQLDSSFIEKRLPPEAKLQIDRALNFYSINLVDKDLRTDEYMSSFKNWVTELEGEPKSIPEPFREHFEVLRSFSSTYREFFWEPQEAQCHAVLAKYLPIIRSTEEQYWDEILRTTKAFILDDIIKVDIVFVGKADKWNTRNRPYTTIFPTRVVMNSYGYEEIEGEWLELLFHESAHALILSKTGFVAGTIVDVAQQMDLKIPRQLGHAYLFYMTGKVAQRLLEEEGIAYPLTYMQNRKVFTRYHESLKLLDEYLNGNQTLSATTEQILKSLAAK